MRIGPQQRIKGVVFFAHVIRSVLVVFWTRQSACIQQIIWCSQLHLVILVLLFCYLDAFDMDFVMMPNQYLLNQAIC